jgi:hypothetical protein
MRDLLDRLRDTIERHCVAPSTNRLPGLLLFRAEAPTTPMDLVMRTAFLRDRAGQQAGHAVRPDFDYDASKYMVTAVDLPRPYYPCQLRSLIWRYA